MKVATHRFIGIPNADIIDTNSNAEIIIFIKYKIQFCSISRAA